MEDFNPLYTDPIQQVQNPLQFNDGSVTGPSDPLAMDIPDDELETIVKQRITASKKFYEDKYNLTSRRKKNEKYLFGRQVAELEADGKLQDYESRSSDNALYEIEGSLKPLGVGKIPDIIVTPGGEDPQRQESAKNLSVVIDDTMKKRKQKEILGLAFKHLPVYFTAVLKARWNQEKGDEGDYDFDEISPEYIVVDHTCTTRNPDDMSYIAHCVPITVQELLMKFPSKKKDIYEHLAPLGLSLDQEPTWKQLATEVKMWEVWFDWYKKKGSKDLLTKSDVSNINEEPGTKWERVSGVLWRIDGCILEKMLDPNYDHEGEDKLFTYDVPGDETTKHEVDPQQLLMAQLMGQPMPPVTSEKIYHNYFKRCHKPFFFYGYDQWGKVYLDETSRIEQNIRNQENLDDQNKTILDQLKTRVKHIWSSQSGMDKATVQRLDMNDPKLDVLVGENPNDVHKAIMPERPDAAQFNALQDTRSRMYAISHASAIRGDLQSDVATTNQIGREGDFSVNDDLADATTTAACEWMAGWQLQFIKLRYTDTHMKEILGAKGEATYLRIRRDSVLDGMEVLIKASSTDKLKAQRNAMETAKLGPPFTNPLDFMRDMDMNDAEGRTERGMLFSIDPMGFYTKYVLGLENGQQMAGAITAGLPPEQPPTGGAPSPAPQNPSPQDTSNVAAAPPTSPPQGSPRML